MQLLDSTTFGLAADVVHNPGLQCVVTEIYLHETHCVRIKQVVRLPPTCFGDHFFTIFVSQFCKGM
jgi:hypothetical protein